MLLLIAPILAAIMFFQLFFGIVCAKRYASTRIPASLLVLIAPFRLVAAIFGEKMPPVFVHY